MYYFCGSVCPPEECSLVGGVIDLFMCLPEYWWVRKQSILRGRVGSGGDDSIMHNEEIKVLDVFMKSANMLCAI